METILKFLATLWRTLIDLIQGSPPPPPEPAPPILPAAYWLAQLETAYAAERVLYYDKWRDYPYHVYFYGYLIRALGAAWLAKPDDHRWLREALRYVTLAGGWAGSAVIARPDTWGTCRAGHPSATSNPRQWWARPSHCPRPDSCSD